MRASSFWKAVTVDQANLLERFLRFLSEQGARYCAVGGQAVNAYVEPLVSLDLDLVVSVSDPGKWRSALETEFEVREFPHSLNVSAPASDLRIQIQTDPRYSEFIDRASEGSVLGVRMPVAALRDVLRGKIWAARDETRRGSKRQKDLADIARLVEKYPELKGDIPADVLRRLI